MAAHFLFSLLLTIHLLTSPSLSQQTQFLFPGFKHSPNLTLSGIAQIQSNGLISLTNHTSRLIGRAFYPTPIRFKRSPNDAVSSFSSIFAFAIVPEYAKLGGHGLAFVFSPKKDLIDGLPSQFLGILNPTNRGNFSNHLFAIEFDTVQDFEFNDINDNHVGVDLNDLKSNFSVSAGYFIDGIPSAQPIKLNSGKTILAWVDYDSAKTQLNVTLSLSSTKPNSPILSVNIDLSPIFKEFMYVGFSSSTGLLASSHYILGWSFKINGEAQPVNLSSLPSLPGRKPKNTSLVIAVSISASIFVILSIGIAFYLIKKKMKKSDVIEDWELEVGPHRFSYKELKLATRGFRDEELLGFGGFGKVYRGVLSDSENEFAVKKISNESKQGIKEFASEIASIGRLRHRNLVQLLGWCRHKTKLLLVYEFMPNGSLDKYLFENPINILSWEERYKIIKDVATGLLYLHEEWEQAVIHRDIKAGNVLLDLEMNGKLGDFGLSKLYEHGSNPNTTKVVGTLGYLAPELTKTGKPSKKSDIFAFGALLLEVVCGRRPIEHKAYPEELILVDWVWDRWRKGAIFEIVDKKLEGEYNEEEVEVVVKIGLMCSNDVAAERPSMRQVVSYLEGEVKLPEVVVPPEGRKGGGGAAESEDFVHSYPPSSRFEKVSLCSPGDGAAEEITDI